MNSNDDDIPHIARTQDTFNVLMVGGGRGGVSLLGLFDHYSWINLKGIVDLNDKAECMDYARTNNIPTYQSVVDALAEFDGNLIIDVTGDAQMEIDLPAMCKHKGVKVITGWSARLLYGLLIEKLKDEELIRDKASQLHLLTTMLQISQYFKQLAGQDILLNEGMAGSAELIVSTTAMALVNENEEMRIIGGTDTERSMLALPHSDVNNIARVLENHKRDELLIELTEPLQLSLNDDPFHLAVPFYINQELRYLLLFGIRIPLKEEIRTSLSVLLSHLQLALEAESKNKLLEELAYRDALTSAYNRRYFDERINQECERLWRMESRNIAVMFLDMDYFKEVNDTLGHMIGDKLLQSIARIIDKNLRSYDILARYGGDEFVALLINVDDINMVSSRILSAINDYIDADDLLDGIQQKPGVSIGIATAEKGDQIDVDSLMIQADKALYAAKQSGRGRINIVKWTEPDTPD